MRRRTSGASRRARSPINAALHPAGAILDSVKPSLYKTALSQKPLKSSVRRAAGVRDLALGPGSSVGRALH
jgi:hypothetical protein